jgi:hypothetical protein
MVDSPDKTGPGGDDELLDRDDPDRPDDVDADPAADGSDRDEDAPEILETEQSEAAPASPGPAPSRVPEPRIIPAKYETIVHKVVKWDPFQRVNQSEKFPFNMFNRYPDGYQKAHRFIPLHIFMRKFLRPAIIHFDKITQNSGVIDPIFKLDADLIKLRAKAQQNGDVGFRADIQKQAQDLVRQFAIDHKDKFKRILDEAVEPLLADLESYDLAQIGEGVAGLGSDQKEAMKQWLDHMKRLCVAAENPDTFVDIYKANAALFPQIPVGISGGMQHYLKMALDTDLRMNALTVAQKSKNSVVGTIANPIVRGIRHVLSINSNPYYRWKPTFWSTVFFARGLFTTSMSDPAARITYHRDIQTGEDGILHNSKIGLWVRWKENIEALERGFVKGYYNDEIRTTPVMGGKGSARENTERFGIKINIFAQSNARNKEGGEYRGADKPEEALQTLIMQAYNSGHDYDAAYAVDRLNSELGASVADAPATIPPNFGTRFEEFIRTIEDPHKKKFAEHIHVLATREGHSPEKFAQRYLERVFKLASDNIYAATIAPGNQILGTPGYNNYVRGRRQRSINAIVAYVFGLQTIEKPPKQGEDAKTPGVKFNWWVGQPPAPAEGETAAKRYGFKNLTTNGPFYTQFLVNWIKLPITAIKGISSFALNYYYKPIWRHTQKTVFASVVSFGALAGAEKLIEWGVGHDLHVPYTNIDIDFGSRGLGAVGWTADKAFLGPVRIGLASTEAITSPFIGEGILGSSNYIGKLANAVGIDALKNGLKAEHFSLDSLGFNYINRNWIGDRGQNDVTITDTKDPATPGGSDASATPGASSGTPAQPALTPEQQQERMLKSFLIATGTLNADGTPSSEANKSLAEHFTSVMRQNPNVLTAIMNGNQHPVIFHSAILNKFKELSGSDFDGQNGVTEADADIARQWLSALGIEQTRELTFRFPADINLDGKVGLQDALDESVLIKAAKILADRDNGYQTNDPAIQAARDNIAKLTGAFNGDFDGDGRFTKDDIDLANRVNLEFEAQQKKSKETVENQGAQPTGPE